MQNAAPYSFLKTPAIHQYHTSCLSQYLFTPLRLVSNSDQRNHMLARPSTSTEPYMQGRLVPALPSGGLRQVDVLTSSNGRSSVTNRPPAKRCIGTHLSRLSDRATLQQVILSGFPRVP